MNREKLTKTFMMISKKPFGSHDFHKKFSALRVNPFIPTGISGTWPFRLYSNEPFSLTANDAYNASANSVFFILPEKFEANHSSALQSRALFC